jgi:hypothetical protein
MTNIPVRDYDGSEKKVDTDSTTEGSDTVHRPAVSLYGKESDAGDTPLAVDSDGDVQVDVKSGSVTLVAGTAEIGKLGANPGVNVGDVGISGVASVEQVDAGVSLLKAVIDEDTQGDKTIIAAPGASTALRIVAIYLKAEGTVTIILKDSDGGSFSGPILLTNGEEFNQVLGNWPIPINTNAAFQINLDVTSVQISGYVLYFQVSI